MAFEEGIRLIEKADEMDRINKMLEENGEDYCEADELEARQDEAYKAYWNALKELAEYLKHTIVGIDHKTAREMAQSKRQEIMNLFSRAKS